MKSNEHLMGIDILMQRKELCFFPILVETLNHVMPDVEDYLRSNGSTTTPKTESSLTRYLAVLSQRDRKMLGIKRYYKSIGNKSNCTTTNEEVYIEAINILQQLGSTDISHVNMSLNKLKNKFSVFLYGIRLKNYLEMCNKKEEVWTFGPGKSEIEKKFEAIKEDSGFKDFLKKEYEIKFIYVHGKNGYDLVDHPQLDLGLFYDKIEIDGTFQFTHLLCKRIGTSNNRFPFSRNFHIELINHIKEAFVEIPVKQTPTFYSKQTPHFHLLF